MRPGTVDYSKWDALGGDSSSEEEKEEEEERAPRSTSAAVAPPRAASAAPVTPAPPPPPPPPPAAAREAPPGGAQRFSLQQLCAKIEGCAAQRTPRTPLSPKGCVAASRRRRVRSCH
jgi:hypothetical protein